MNVITRFSAIPVGEKFEYNNQVYTRFTHNRGKQIINGKSVFINIHKNKSVIWLNAYTNE